MPHDHLPIRAHLVHAHPEPASFVAAMRDTAVEALTDAGVEVAVSDLYAEGFDAVGGRKDFLATADPSRFHYQREQLHAARTGTFAADVSREQDRLADAHLIVFVFPLWWGGPPAILKGWFERVLAYGFAYEDGMRYERGYLRGRRALLGISTGGTARRFSAGDAYGPIEEVLRPVQHCLLDYLGVQSAAPFVAYASPRVDDAQRSAYLASWRERVLDLLDGLDPGASVSLRDPALPRAESDWATD